MKFLTLKVSLFITFLIISGFGCSKAPTSFDRDNLNDPVNPDFTVNIVENFETEILADQIIRISWDDTTSYGTGYIIRKSISGLPNDFEILDTLDLGETSFTDTSQEASFNTSYGISKIIELKEGDNESEISYTTIDFGGINYLFSGLNADSNAVILDWEFETLWPYTSVVYYFDGNDLVPVDTLYNGESIYLSPTFELDFAERYYSMISRVDLTSTKDDEVIGRIDGGYYGGMEFAPQITNIEVVNEGKATINWKDNSNFEDSFKLFRTKATRRSEIGEYVEIGIFPANTTTYTDTLNPFSGYVANEFGGTEFLKTYYGIKAFKNDTEAGSFSTEVFVDIEKPELSIQSTTTGSITLNWDTNSSDQIESYILQRKVDDLSFIDYQSFSASVTQFTDTEIDTNNTYTYRIKSVTSRPSEEIKVAFVGSPMQVAFYGLDGANQIKFSKSENLITASLENDTRIAIVDISTGNIIYSKSVSQSYLSGPSIYEPENLIGYYSTQDGFFTVKDFEADTTVFNLDNPLGAFPNFVTSMFSEEDNSLYLMTGRSELKKYDLTTKQVVFSKPAFGSTSTIREFDLSTNRDSIVFNYGGSFQLIDSTGSSLNFSPSLPSNSLSQKVRFSPSGKYISLISGFDDGYIYNAKTKDEVRSLSTEAISFSHDEKYLATKDHDLLEIYDFESMSLKMTKEFNSAVLDVKFSSKENILFVSTEYDGIFKFQIVDNKIWGQIN